MSAGPVKVTILLILLLSTTTLAMPLKPDLVVELEEEGRLEEARETLVLSAAELQARQAMTDLDSIRILVILVDFEDVPADTILHSKSSYEHLLFSRQNQYSLAEYFDWNSYGKLDIKGDIYGWFRCPEPLSYYADGRKGMGTYPRNTQRMVEHALEVADPEVDFSRYDSDGPDGVAASGDDDGFVDFLFVIHSGQGYEWTMNPDHIHSHVASILAEEVDGVFVKTYATEPEHGKVGTYAHELGHLFGLPDLYDVTLNTFGLGMWSLMSYGSWGGGDGSMPVGLDSWCRYKLGFLEPVVIDSNTAGYQLPCIEDGPHALRLWSNAESGPQYFLVENRRAKDWDSFISWFGEGLLIYHVDERIRDNSVEGDHLVSLEQADGRSDLEQRRTWGFGSDAGDPYPGSTGNREFSWWTIPSSYSNEGIPTEVSMHSIGDPGDTVQFDVEVRSPIIVFDSYLIDDSAGNGDGNPDPGEEMDVDIRLRNYGAQAHGVTARLHTDDPNVDPQEVVLRADLIPRNSFSDPLRFHIAFAEEITEPYEVTYNMEISASYDYGEYYSEIAFTISVPLQAVPGWPRSAPDMFSGPVAVADIDCDGFLEILVGCANKWVYAWNKDGSPVPGWPVYAGGVVMGKPAVCDIDIDGRPDVIVSSRDGRVYAYRNDGKRLDGWPQPTEGSILSSPLLSDIDDDGMVEVICASSDGKVYAWNEDGRKMDGWPVDVGGSEIWMSPAAADINGDHVAEVVVGGYGGDLYVLKRDGGVLDGWPVPIGRGCGRGSPAVADFDGDGSLDIAVSGLFANSVYLVGTDGKVKEGWPRWPYNCGGLSASIPADVDNDGLPEIAVATSCGTIAAWNADGTECEVMSGHAAHPVYNSEPLFVDLDGNDAIEGIIGTSGKDTSEVDAFGAHGRVLGFPISIVGRVGATPAVADIDNDGSMEIIVATTSGDLHVWRFRGAQPSGRVEYSQARGDAWNTGIYGFKPNANKPMADLSLSADDISIAPAKPKVGDTLFIDVIVTNGGHKMAEAFDIKVYHDEVSDSTLIESFDMPSLDAKREVSLSVNWRVPGGKASRRVIVTLDSEDTVLELSELNNQAGQRFYLALADLDVVIGGVDPFPVVLTDTLVVRATLRNSGEDVATHFVLAFYDSIVTEDRCFATLAVDTLLPGDSLRVTPTHRIDLFRDDYEDVWAVVDLEDAVLEYHHDNNVCRFRVYSGISGNLVTALAQVPGTEVVASRSHLAIESSQGHSVMVVDAQEQYKTAFEALGFDLDLCRKTAVFSTGGDIVGYDLRDSVMFVVSTLPAYEFEPVVWGDNVAWISESPGRTDLLMRRSVADAETISTSHSGGISGPDISYTFLVWQEQGENGDDILGYDLLKDSLITVCSDRGDQENPSIWGNIVVWEDHSTDGGDVSGVDLGTGGSLGIEGRVGLQLNPQVAGSTVVWQDSRNGNWDIYGYGLRDKTEFPVSRQSADQILPTLSDSTVFWIDKRNPLNGIIGLCFGRGLPVVDIRRFEALSQDGQISLLLEADEHIDAVTYRLYRYPDDRTVLDDRITHIRHEFRLGPDSLYLYSDSSVAARRPFFYTLGVIDGYGEETLYGPVSGTSYAPAPEILQLSCPFPNPSRGVVSFNFGLPRRSSFGTQMSWPDPEDEPRMVSVCVYDVTGRLVRTLQAGAMTPGHYRFYWDGRNGGGRQVSPGVYFINAHTGSDNLTRKVILLR